MKLKKYLLFILAAASMASCSTGKYYANKRINHHYESAAPASPATAKQAPQKQAEIVNNAIPVTTESTTPAADNTPLIPYDGGKDQKIKVDLKPGNYTLPATVVTEPAAEPAAHESVNKNPVLKQVMKVVPVKETKGVGKFLLFFLVALLCILLAIVFLALGDLGVIFFIIFMIAAVVLCIAGIVALFTN